MQKTGWFYKRGGTIKTWKRRYFILDTVRKTLSYSKDETEAPIDTIDLQEYHVADIPASKRKEGTVAGFQLEKENARCYLFSFDIRVERDEWFLALDSALKPPTARVNSKASDFTPIRARLGTDQFSSHSIPNPGIAPEDESIYTSVGISRTASEVHGSYPRTLPSNNEEFTLVNNTQTTSIHSKLSRYPSFALSLRLISLDSFHPSHDKLLQRTIKIGRIVADLPVDKDFIGYNSKVVSRSHCEIWANNGEVYVRDVKSQSGTFLNGMRLSEAGLESKPYTIKSGDVLQFGVDYKNSTNPETKCVAVRVQITSSRLAGNPIQAGQDDTDETLCTDESNTLVRNEDGTLT